jgi:hypothetical protein
MRTKPITFGFVYAALIAGILWAAPPARAQDLFGDGGMDLRGPTTVVPEAMRPDGNGFTFLNGGGSVGLLSSPTSQDMGVLQAAFPTWSFTAGSTDSLSGVLQVDSFTARADAD